MVNDDSRSRGKSEEARILIASEMIKTIVNQPEISETTRYNTHGSWAEVGRDEETRYHIED